MQKTSLGVLGLSAAAFALTMLFASVSNVSAESAPSHAGVQNAQGRGGVQGARRLFVGESLGGQQNGQREAQGLLPQAGPEKK